MQRQVQWLLGELPHLVQAGVLSEQSAEAIRSHYVGENDQAQGRNWAVVLFAILGAVLVGGGVILLIAHNWDGLLRPARVALSLAPLVLSQAAAVLVLRYRGSSVAWKEGMGTFWALCIGACISLIAQTYHISGSFSRFMLTWVLLALPIVYLMRSALVAVLYVIGITTWSGAALDESGSPGWFFVLSALLVPFVAARWRLDKHQPKRILLNWVWSLCACLVTGFVADRIHPDAWIAAYALCLPVLYLAGAVGVDGNQSAATRPFQLVGGLGVALFSLILTFDSSWHAHLSWRAQTGHWHMGVGVMLGVVAAGFAVITLRYLDARHLAVAVAPAVVALGYWLQFEQVVLTQLLFNAYLAALGLVVLISGVRRSKLAAVNLGLAMLSVLIIVRFFDRDYSFLVRGVAFVVVGLAFLSANFWLTRRRVAK